MPNFLGCLAAGSLPLESGPGRRWSSPSALLPQKVQPQPEATQAIIGTSGPQKLLPSCMLPETVTHTELSLATAVVSPHVMFIPSHGKRWPHAKHQNLPPLGSRPSPPGTADAAASETPHTAVQVVQRARSRRSGACWAPCATI